MSNLIPDTTSTISACMCYRDAPAAIEWLCNVFGFARRAVHADDDGSIVHAELTFGNGMIMISSVKDSDYGRLLQQPDEMGGRVTQSVCVVTTDPDEIYRRANTAGARILLDIEDKNYGGRGFTCADLEGHVWTFGSYDPWQAV